MEPFQGFDSDNRRLTPLRLSVFAAMTAVLGPAAYVSLLAAGASRFSAIGVLVALLLPAGRLGVRWVPARLSNPSPSQRTLLILWLALSAAAGYRVASLGAFMLDVQQSEYAMDPPRRESDDPQMEKPFFPKHNCFTCYIVATELARQGTENIYDRTHYRDAEKKTAIHETIGDALNIDRFQYPPPFLLLPRLLLATGGDFFQLRTYWFTINVVLFSVTTAALLLWFGGSEFNAYWLVWPILLICGTTLSTLQVGNAHFFVVCISLLAMVCFETKRLKLGGVLLGFAIVSKIFPGLLLVYLLARRRWTDVAWTGAAMVAYCLATIAVFGTQPFHAFVSYQLPRIASGEAFSFAFEYIRPLTLNWSVMGIFPKLEKLGWIADIDGAAARKIVSVLYSGLLLLIVVPLGLKHGPTTPPVDRDANGRPRRVSIARIWLVVLVLAQFRSPFLPWAYGGTAILWLLLLLLPSQGKWTGKALLLGLGCLLVSTHIPLPYGPPKTAFDLSYTLAAQLGVLVLCLLIVIADLRMPSRRAIR